MIDNPTETKEPQHLIEQAKALMQDEQWAAALLQWEHALQQSPQLFPAWAGKGNALLQLQDFEAAEAWFTQMIDTFPQRIHGYIGYARLTQKQHQWELATQRWSDILERFPDNQPALIGQSKALLELGRYDKANQHYERLRKAHPQQSQGYIGSITIAMRMEKWQLAVDLSESTIEKFPQNLWAYVSKGNALIQLSQFEQAEAVFQSVPPQHLHALPVLRGLAQIAIKTESWHSALEQCDALIARFPLDPKGYSDKLAALVELKQFTEAAALVENLPLQQPLPVNILRRILDVVYNTQQWELFLTPLHSFIQDKGTQLVTLIPEKRQFYRLFEHSIQLLLNSGKLVEVESLLETLETHGTVSVFSTIWRATLLQHQGRCELATQTCSDALMLYPQYAQHLYLALAQQAWKRFDLNQALSFCKGISPSDSHIYAQSCNLTYQILIRLEQSDEAKRTLRSLIQYQPKNASGYWFLAELLCFHDKDYEETVSVCNQAIQQGISHEWIYCCNILALSSLGQHQQALTVSEQYLNHHHSNHLIQMARAQALRNSGQYEQSIATINDWLAEGQFDPISSHGPQHELNIQYIQCNPDYVVNSDDLVSVIMTTYGWDDLTPVAISSILQQTYRNIELIIVDDGSPDDTFRQLQEIAASDPRIRLTQLTKNSGTYVAKNHGMSISKGKYISFMDSDDWFHPQAIERQVDILINTDVMGVTFARFRVQHNSDIEFKPEKPIYQAEISLCFKREPVFNQLGYFDAVRTAADTEYIERIQTIFGPKAITPIQCPLGLSTRHEKSITGGGSLKFRWHGPANVDQIYNASFRKWHAHLRTDGLSPFLPHPPIPRRFEAPQALLS